MHLHSISSSLNYGNGCIQTVQASGGGEQGLVLMQVKNGNTLIAC